MIIKVCGLREPDNIRAVEALGVDMTGLIFFPRSPRFVCQPLPHQMAKRSERVGVFVDSAIDNMIQKAKEYDLDCIQLHGSESPNLLKELRKTFIENGQSRMKLIKAFNILTIDDLSKTQKYEGLADLFLFDTKTEHAGGSGQKFDWSILSAYNGKTKFLLSGGIRPGDEAEILAFSHPMMAGIDLNSRFEQQPGIKDVGALCLFLDKIQAISKRQNNK